MENEKKITLNLSKSVLERIDHDVEYSMEYLDREDWIREAIRHYEAHRLEIFKLRRKAYP